MKKYVGTKIIEAVPMTNEEFCGLQDNNPNRTEGYKVIYENGYVSWSPKEVFEKAYMPIEDGTKITEIDVVNYIYNLEASKVGEKTTVVVATLRNGFIIVESSSCVDPKNFDMELGESICFQKIKNKVWEYLGFMLQCGKN